MQLIKTRLTVEQYKDFVQYGGLRLLRRWIKSAEELDHVDEMITMLTVCELLPFDAQAAKVSDIGKSIKRLSKFTSPSGKNVQKLQEKANEIMQKWTKLMTAASAAVAATQSQNADSKVSTATASSVKDASATLTRTTTLPSTIAAATSTLKSKPVATEAKPTTPNLLDIIRSSEGRTISAATNSISSAKPVSNLTTSSSTSITPMRGEKRERNSLDMEARARKLLEAKSQRAAPTVSSTAMDVDYVDDNNNDGIMGSSSTQMNVLAPTPLGRGGLKSKDKPKKKMSVNWADETGGLLREVHLIEVDKIKSSVANYKSHKDLVKKERQLEKEIYETQETESMVKTSDWRAPKRLKLPIEIIDNIGVPSGSIDRDIQSKRHNEVAEAIHLDESLIPDDPDEDPHMYDDPSDIQQQSANDDEDLFGDRNAKRQKKSTAPNVSVRISWYLDDEIPEAAPVANTMPGSMMMNNNFGNNMMMDTGYGFNQSNVNGMYGGIQAQQQPQVMKEFDVNTFINSLPPAIQALDPTSLQMIIDDQSLLPTLTRPDNSVNQSNLRTLELSNTIAEYRAKIGIPQFPPAQPLQPQTPQALWNSMQNQQHQQQFIPMFGQQMNQQPHQQQMFQQQRQAGGLQMQMATHMMNFQMQQPQQMQQPGMMMMPGNNLGMMSNNMGRMMGRGNQQQGQQKVHTGTKAGTPCRFFNTSRGCINGDKCPFGHFATAGTNNAAGAGGGDDSTGGNVAGMAGRGRMGMGMGMGNKGGKRGGFGRK